MGREIRTLTRPRVSQVCSYRFERCRSRGVESIPPGSGERREARQGGFGFARESRINGIDHSRWRGGGGGGGRREQGSLSLNNARPARAANLFSLRRGKTRLARRGVQRQGREGGKTRFPENSQVQSLAAPKDRRIYTRISRFPEKLLVLRDVTVRRRDTRGPACIPSPIPPRYRGFGRVENFCSRAISQSSSIAAHRR